MAPQSKILAIFDVDLRIFAVRALGNGGQNNIFGGRLWGFVGRNMAQNKAEVEDEIDPQGPSLMILNSYSQLYFAPTNCFMSIWMHSYIWMGQAA